MPTGTYRHTLLERVVHGQPFEKAVADEVLATGAKRVLVIASPRAHGSDALARLRVALGDHFSGEFCQVLPHVPVECVRDAAVWATQLNADHLVALGGGSVIDAAKAISLLVWSGMPLQVAQLLDQQDLRLVDPSQRSRDDEKRLRITAVPQTLSGAEFTWFAGVTDPSRKVKNIVAHATMAPRCVILDPSLTLEIPVPIFLASGVKAIDHAVERLVSLHSHPMSDALSIHALRMLSQALPAVHSNPGDLMARQQCQLASWLSIAGGAAGVKTGASHALGHILGAHSGVAHGLTSCALLSPVLRWNKGHNGSQQCRVMSALGVSNTDLGSWVERLVSSLGLPTRLRELNVDKRDLPDIAQKSLHDPGMHHNPRPIRSATDALEILEHAW
ncbi:iron-containing alcohol dehydrogenase [Ottowia thiooxydans]|uniref:iron-containing alcohol dehydrogenase n=1 Tax=Ottowia thiooxydans TaxID=219182 RepID=UPI000407BD08|nr:iron-containing alcohol dehydrogenase [Ottowia thiooxydans]